MGIKQLFGSLNLGPIRRFLTSLYHRVGLARSLTILFPFSSLSSSRLGSFLLERCSVLLIIQPSLWKLPAEELTILIGFNVNFLGFSRKRTCPSSRNLLCFSSSLLRASGEQVEKIRNYSWNKLFLWLLLPARLFP